jgi:hypothetical protein
VTDDRFELLVERYLEGTLTEEEARELLEAPASRLLDEVATAGLLARVHGRTPDLSPKVQAALRGSGDKAALVENVLLRLPGRRRGIGVGGMAAAALVAAGLGLALYLFTSRPVAPSPSVAGQTRAQAEAVRKGIDYLRSAQLPPATHNAPMPPDDLVLLALADAGVPETDPFFRSLFEKALDARLQRTYTVSIHAMLLRRLDPEKHHDRLAACAKFLVDHQCVNGQWSYGDAAIVPSPPLSGNNSCSLFAAQGLRACHDAGIPVPRETLDRAARWWRESRRAYPNVGDGEVAGWCYSREESPHRPYGSMTAGAVAALMIEDALLGLDWKKDAAVQAGLRWLTKYFTVTENFGPVEELMAKELASDTPNLKTELYYYLWALERIAGVAGLQAIGGRDWHAEGTQEILQNQRADGSWFSGVRRCHPVYDTCYAILFLTHSTRAVSP